MDRQGAKMGSERQEAGQPSSLNQHQMDSNTQNDQQQWQGQQGQQWQDQQQQNGQQVPRAGNLANAESAEFQQRFPNAQQGQQWQGEQGQQDQQWRGRDAPGQGMQANQESAEFQQRFPGAQHQQGMQSDIQPQIQSEQFKNDQRLFNRDLNQDQQEMDPMMQNRPEWQGVGADSGLRSADGSHREAREAGQPSHLNQHQLDHIQKLNQQQHSGQGMQQSSQGMQSGWQGEPSHLHGTERQEAGQPSQLNSHQRDAIQNQNQSM